MSANASPAAKKGGNENTKYDIDSVLPVLLASLGNPTIDYKAMAAMDELERTEFAWQHRFRRWKVQAKDILAAHGDEAGSNGAKPKIPSPGKKATNGVRGKKTNDGPGDDEEGEGVNAKAKPSSKKRGAATEESPAKKTKTQKKGTAQKSKTGNVNKFERDESAKEISDKAVVKKEKALSEDEEDMKNGVEMEFRQEV